MSTVAHQVGTGSQVRTSSEAMQRSRQVIVPAVILLSYLPLLLLHFRRLWMSDHYRYFPLILAVAAYLLWKRWPDSSADPARQQPYRPIWVMAGLVLLMVSVVAWSPWLAAISAIITIRGLFPRDISRETAGGLTAVWLLLWLLIPLPAGMDLRLIFWLQGFASSAGSLLLEAIGVRHLLEGHVIEVPDRQFMVDEACSGIRSLFTLIALTAIYVVTTRRAFLQAILLICSAVFWAVVLNALRLTFVVALTLHTGIDFASGTPHELLGLVLFVFALLMLLSTDRMLSFFLEPVDPEELRREGAIGYYGYGGYYRRAPAGQTTATKNRSGPTGEVPKPKRSLLAAFGLPGIFVCLGLVQLPVLVAKEIKVQSVSDNLAWSVPEDVLPATYADWTRTDWEREERQRDDEFGARSLMWTYQNPTSEAVVSLDFPFWGWHEISHCYQGIGWTVASHRVLSTDETGEAGRPTIVEFELQKATGERGYLLFGMFDSVPETYPVPAAYSPLNSDESFSLREFFVSRIIPWGREETSPEMVQTHQLQLLHISDENQSPVLRAELKTMYLDFRRAVLQQLRAQS